MKRKALAISGGVLSLCVCLPVWSLQIKHALDNGTVSVHIARSGLTRIAVKYDKINRLQGIQGTYTHTFDKTLGVLYIMPTATQAHTPFSIFISTEKGRTYSLKLTPTNASAESILLLPAPTDATPIAVNDHAVQHDKALIQWIKAMATHEGLPTVLVKTINHASPIQIGEIAQAHLVKRYFGERWEGRVYTVINLTDRALSFSDRLLYQPGVLAIALAHKRVKAHGQTQAYLVLPRVS